MLAEQAEMKADDYHCSICFVFPSDEHSCGVCLLAHLCRGTFRCPCEQGTQPAAFARAVGVSRPGAASQSRRAGEVRENPAWALPPWGCTLSTNGEVSHTCREVSHSINSGFCFLLCQQCPGPGQHSQKASPRVNIHQQLVQRWIHIKYKSLNSLPCIIMDLTPSVLMHVTKVGLSSPAWNCLPRRPSQYCT